MENTIITKNLLPRKLYYIFLLVKRGGLGTLLRYFWSRVHSKTTYIWMAKELSSSDSRIPCKVPYSLQPASPVTFQKLLDGLKWESGQTVLEILRRISFYERGFDTCHVALTDSGEICNMEWSIFPRQNDLIRTTYPFGMPILEKNEVLLENVFTFPRYRNNGVMASVTLDLARIARSQGFSRMLAYVDKDNKASSKSLHNAGFRTFAKEQETRLLFRAWRRKLL